MTSKPDHACSDLNVKPNTCCLHASGDSLAGTCYAGTLLAQVRQIMPHQTEALSAMYVGSLNVLFSGEPKERNLKSLMRELVSVFKIASLVQAAT